MPLWWVLAPIAGTVIAGLLGTVSNDEKKARENWARKHREVERTISEHRENIRKHIEDAQKSLDFHFLVDLHYSSFRVADNAYGLMDDARTSINAIGRMLDNAKAKKEELKKLLDDKPTRAQRKQILSRIYEINDFRSALINDIRSVKEEKRHFLDELHHYNEQTRVLKLAIRDRCGKRGWEWYEDLQKRIAAKRNMENH